MSLTWNGMVDVVKQIRPEARLAAVERLADPGRVMASQTWQGHVGNGCPVYQMTSGVLGKELSEEYGTWQYVRVAAQTLGLPERTIRAFVDKWDFGKGFAYFRRQRFIQEIRRYLGELRAEHAAAQEQAGLSSQSEQESVPETEEVLV